MDDEAVQQQPKSLVGQCFLIIEHQLDWPIQIVDQAQGGRLRNIAVPTNPGSGNWSTARPLASAAEPSDTVSTIRSPSGPTALATEASARGSSWGRSLVGIVINNNGAGAGCPCAGAEPRLVWPPL
jgi:hypothetical protein